MNLGTVCIDPYRRNKKPIVRAVPYIRQLVQQASLSTQQHEEENDYDPLTSDASTSLDVRQVLSFAFASLLRLNVYAKTRVALIAPLWRGLCDLASDFLPISILEDATQALSDYLQQGLERLIASVSQSVHEKSSSPSQQPNLTVQAKLIGFLVARVTSLMKIANSNSNITIISGVCKTLVGLRGTAMASNLLFLQHNHSNIALLKTCQDIGSKVEKCLLSVVIDLQVVHRPTLDALLRIQAKTPRSNIHFGQFFLLNCLWHMGLVLF
jgi:hypothetical protein